MNLSKNIKTKAHKELAASLVEYCFAVGLIALVAISAVKTFAGSVDNLFTTSNTAIQN